MKISKKRGVSIAPEMYGLFFEDINFAADGGLYAEMIENRSFEAKNAFGSAGTFYMEDDFGYAWSPVGGRNSSDSLPRLQYITAMPLSTVNPHYLRITAKEAGQGVANKAYDGICLKKGVSCHVTFYARCVNYEGTGFEAAVRKDGKTYASASVKAVKPAPYHPFCDSVIDFDIWGEENSKRIREIKAMDKSELCKISDWIQYSCELESEEEVRGAQFELTLDAPGIVEFDYISMIPSDAVAGVFRKDLFDALQSINPGFIRFPGGCIVEGISLDNGYQWKETVGDNIHRRFKQNLWAFDDDRAYASEFDHQRPDSHYGQSYGIGFYEYFLLCELLGAKPLPILSIGAACQFRTTEVTEMDSPEFYDYVQDALDLIEFANGPADSEWGSLRAEMGHPEPFGMELLGVGNEQWQTTNVEFYERASVFENIIHEVYPDMKIIGSAGPVWDCPIKDHAWNFYREAVKQKDNAVYAVDEHYYVPPVWMYDHIGMYDEYPRDIAVFAGEYAAHTPKRENSMESALAEAAIMTGYEKNADVVRLASYAPLFNRIGHSQWKPDMIWFDDRQVYLTPNYYVQKLFANHVGDHTLDMGDEIEALRKDGVYAAASETADGETILKLVNTNKNEYELPVLNSDGSAVTVAAKTWTLTGTGAVQEGMPEESAIAEASIQINGSVVLPAESVTVVRY